MFTSGSGSTVPVVAVALPVVVPSVGLVPVVLTSPVVLVPVVLVVSVVLLTVTVVLPPVVEVVVTALELDMLEASMPPKVVESEVDAPSPKLSMFSSGAPLAQAEKKHQGTASKPVATERMFFSMRFRRGARSCPLERDTHALTLHHDQPF